MATLITTITIGNILKQTGTGTPNHIAPKGSEFTDISSGLLYINKNGINDWVLNIDTSNSGSTFDSFVSGGSYNVGAQEINFVGNSLDTTFDVDLSSLINTVSGDTFVTGQTFDNSTYILSTKRNDGLVINSDLSILASDIYVLSGVYNPSTGIVTYTNNSGGTFQVSGFTTGMTDSYTTAANLNGETIEFNNNIQGSNLYNVNLTPLLSGKTDNTDFTSHTGDTSIHFTKGSINLSDLGSTAHTHTLS